MRVVVRNEKYAKRHLWAYPQPETFTYEGEQVPAYKWSEPGTICLTTGDPRWPVREIHPSNIISVDDTAVEQPKQAPAERTIQIADPFTGQPASSVVNAAKATVFGIELQQVTNQPEAVANAIIAAAGR